MPSRRSRARERQERKRSRAYAPAAGRAYRLAARTRALAASTSRFLGGALVIRVPMSRCTALATSSTAWSNASWLAADGLVKPLTFRTNCSEALRISASVTGGSKWNSGRMLRHIVELPPEGLRESCLGDLNPEGLLRVFPLQARSTWRPWTALPPLS